MNIDKRAAALIAAFGILASGAALAAQPQVQKVQTALTADDIQYNVNTGDANAVGNVVVTRGASTLSGEKANGNTEKEIMTITGNVKGDFPEKGVKLVADSATWTGDKSKKTDGTVEAFGKVLLTRAPKDRLNADYVLWNVGTENYKARGSVDGIFENRALKAAEATRIGDKFWARDVKRYEDMIQKFVLSARTVDGRLVKDAKTGEERMEEMVANKDVVFDYVDKQGLKTRVTGDKAVYAKARGTIVVSGGAKAVRSDGKTVTADTMVVHEDTRIIEGKGNSKVTFLIDEKKKKEDAKPADKVQPKAAKKQQTPGAEAASADKAAPAPEKPKAGGDKKYQLNDEDRGWVEGK